MKRFCQSIPWMKAVKIAMGAVLAILLAEVLGLTNTASAGIITLLTVQNTRRKTFSGILRRLAVFALMTLISAPIYALCGTKPWTFGIVLLLLLLLCYGLRLEDSIPINAVMATYYMAAGGVSWFMLQNELLFLIIGSGIGLPVNWFMLDNFHKIRQKHAELDE
ncbi:MAG: aromatic acid exporter family protein [Ruminococcus sp.]|nr:aromatic acid exporter family protein [Ruminococcus sp.]